MVEADRLRAFQEKKQYSLYSNKADGFRRAITSGEDLDTFFEWGSYYITAAASSGVANVPEETALHLYVMRADGDKNGANVSRTIQIAVESSIGSIYECVGIMTVDGAIGRLLVPPHRRRNTTCRWQKGLLLCSLALTQKPIWRGNIGWLCG